ncbi:putative 25-hydroxycholesterol 7-alpha-hydroxylase [Daldinia decipiens]|uniref:putative 25-hydroxycholesterol 7-alpha-hydroxylase n=1 Tax=Daldinia decipiens TaxID=326647 RepID=UPI0020C52CCE|nr:putative 25-hydroxycholesterol 7-alpha-hydroxylase [Daldinia decipiens]KAI1658736.1 putative 25-hydroxycholesterol 7-alpha-hydroxylase [Daldinia decipiens]
MVRWSMDFYSFMRKRYHDLPIYTLRIPGARIYVINSLDFIPVVQRQWRTLIFAPIQVKAAQAAMGVSKDSIAIMERDMVTESGFVNGPDAPTTMSMFAWIDTLIMHATTDAVYGPSNPMRNASNIEDWHKYHPALMFLMLDIFPQNVFFRGAIQSRDNLVKGFAKYYEDGSYKQGSAYIQQFTKHCIDQKIPEIDIPRLLLGTVFNNIANTSPSAFWVIYHVFSDPVVLQECRDEVKQAVQDDPDGTSTIHLSFVLNSYPVLLSTYNEVFRYHGMANSVRVVSEDHMLDNRYLLKKGGLVMLSARVQHKNPAVWGENRINAVAFRGFGGGTTLCPGRHFATSEILLLTTMLLLRFDIQPADGKPWVLPSTAKSSQAEAMEQPDDDISIKLIPRPEASGRTWRVSFSGQQGAE